MFRQIRCGLLLFPLLTLSACDQQSEAPATQQQSQSPFTPFQGNYFYLEYPTVFIAQPSLKAESGEGYDSVFFKHRESDVSFYLCAPAWERECSDFSIDPEKEDVLVKDPPINTGLFTLTRINVAAKDGSYERLIEQRLLEEDNQMIISGARYDNLESFEAVRPYYIGMVGTLRYPGPPEE